MPAAPWPADEVVRISLETLTPYARNSRQHSEEQVAQIANSIVEFGFTIPILISEDGSIIAGHGRVMAAKLLNMVDVPAMVARGWSEEKRRAYVIADNKLAENAAWDDELLKLELEWLSTTDFDLSLTGFDQKELEKMLAGSVVGNTDDDAIPDVHENVISMPGDVWIMGQHRLICGDATSTHDFETLMGKDEKIDLLFTDPPYGVSVLGGRRQTVADKKIKSIANDELRGDALCDFIEKFISAVPLKSGASFYICYDHKTQFEFHGALRKTKLTYRNTIVWNKNNFGLSPKPGYRPKYELIMFGYSGENYSWHGDKGQADVWDIPRPTERVGNHPTPKPVELVERAIFNSSETGDIVCDCFCGSGTTLIACEKTDRIARVMELSPEYCDVIVRRWQDFTGKKAYLESSKELFNDLAEPQN